MAVYEDREAFIPYRRTDLINLCLEDNRLSADDAPTFQDFAEILSAFYHFRFHQTIEQIKDNYFIFDPNADVQTLDELTLEQYEEMEAKVINEFKYLLERANYIPLPDSVIQEALSEKSLINLKTEVDFNDFAQFVAYYRGDTYKNIKLKKFMFWTKDKKIEIFERIILLIKFKGEGYFQAKKTKKNGGNNLNYTPGKMYVYFYKNIPQLDLDLLFPNIETSMTWKDKLLFGGTAIGAAVPLILKAVPNLLLIAAAILLVFNAPTMVESLQVEPEKARNVMPVLVATLSLAGILGGFAVKQYSQYKSKQIKFQKDVSDTLFFKNLANNSSVFQVLADIAEEEECKEIILVYYHLLTSSVTLTPEQLDSKIEDWMEEKLGTKIDFDINGPLNNLQEIKGNLFNQTDVPLLSYDSQGRCHVLPLKDARVIIDYVWDNAFQYNGFTH